MNVACGGNLRQGRFSQRSLKNERKRKLNFKLNFKLKFKLEFEPNFKPEKKLEKLELELDEAYVDHSSPTKQANVKSILPQRRSFLPLPRCKRAVL